jgi:tetratricopeptide (TPR) repeat protein
MSVRRRVLATVLFVCCTTTVLSAQLVNGGAVRAGLLQGSADYQKAVALDNSGQSAQAVELLRTMLDRSPADFRALEVIERALIKLDQRAQMLPIVARALTADSTGTGVMGLAIRVFAGLQLPDSARKYATRWLMRMPGDATPFREWSEAASEVRDHPGALAALEDGRRLLATPSALAPELAQAYQFTGNYARASQEWVTALQDNSLNRAAAVYLLGQTPLTQRSVVNQELLRAGSPEARWLYGLVQIRWGQVVEGTTLIRSSLPNNSQEALGLLRDLLDQLSDRNDHAALLARATVLEAMAQRELGSAIIKTRMDAATAYADAGADRDARRMLGMVSGDPSAPRGAGTAASTTVLGVLIAEGKPAEAEAMLDSLQAKLDSDTRDLLRHRIAMLWARHEEFARALHLVGSDSSVAGIDLIGRIRLFTGDLAGAALAFRYAGPFDDNRAQSVSRITILALLQAIGQDSSPRLGNAFLALERNDSVTALRLFDSLAVGFPNAGAAEAHLLAGRLAAGLGDTTRALALFTAADLPDLPGTAAAARLQRARLIATRGQHAEAQRLAESIILDFPESAVVPDARRLRDELRGALSVKVP